MLPVQPYPHPTLGLALVFAATLGCAAEPTPAPSPSSAVGFGTPTAAVRANQLQGTEWLDVGPADLTCLGTASDDQPTIAPGTLETTVEDFMQKSPLEAGQITGFHGIALTAPFAVSNVSTGGKLALQLPAGTTRFGLAIEAPGYMRTLLLNQRVVDPGPTYRLATVHAVSVGTATTIPAVIGLARTPGTGIIAGAFRDCQGREVSNFVATVSRTPDAVTRLGNAPTYYFSTGDRVVPVRTHVAPTATGNGLFTVLELPPTPTAYVQIWGYATEAALANKALSLLAQLEVPILPDVVITGSYAPRRL